MCRPLSKEERESLDKGLCRLVTWANTNNAWTDPDGYSDVGIAIIDAVMAAGNKYDKVIRPIMGRIVAKYKAVGVKDANWLMTEFAKLAPRHLRSKKRGDLLVKQLLENGRPMMMGRNGTRPRGLVIEDTATALLSYQSALAPNGLGTYSDWAKIRVAADASRKAELRSIYGQLRNVDGIGEATSRYLAILIGCPEVKPDIHTRWFLKQHSGTTGTHSDKCIGDELVLAAERIIASGLTAKPVTAIDHLMWRQKSSHIQCADGNPC